MRNGFVYQVRANYSARFLRAKKIQCNSVIQVIMRHWLVQLFSSNLQSDKKWKTREIKSEFGPLRRASTAIIFRTFKRLYVRAGLHRGKFLPFFRYSALSSRVLVQILSCCILVSCRVSFSFRGTSEIHEGLETPETISRRFRYSALSFAKDVTLVIASIQKSI